MVMMWTSEAADRTLPGDSSAPGDDVTRPMITDRARGERVGRMGSDLRDERKLTSRVCLPILAPSRFEPCPRKREKAAAEEGDDAAAEALISRGQIAPYLDVDRSLDSGERRLYSAS